MQEHGLVAAPAPALLVLRAQLDVRWPERSRVSDGIMGDAAHQARPSDHNLGNAIDITRDEANGPNLDAVLHWFLRQMRANPNGRITYVIHRGRIAGAASLYEWKRYRGANPHTSHAHLSIKADMRGVERRWSIAGA